MGLLSFGKGAKFRATKRFWWADRVLAVGEVVKVELENEHGVLAYELKIVTGSGRLIELQIDARTGAILKREAE